MTDKFTEHTGIVLREDGSLLVWSEDTRIEIVLSPEQMLSFSEALYKQATKNDRDELCQTR